MMGHRGRLLACCNLSLWLCATPLFAQSAAGEPQPAPRSPSKPAAPAKSRVARPSVASGSDLGARATPTNQDLKAAGSEIGQTIVVTGTHRRSTLQKTAIAITAFTDERRNLIGVRNGQDIVNLTPSASLQGDYLSIRGVGRFEDAGQGLDPGIAINVDGVYTASPSYLSQPDFLTDRVEVVRGPQLITGHENAGGEVNLYSRRPTDDYHADIRFGGTTQAEGYSNAAFSGPITDNLKFRVAEAYDTTGGPGGSNLAPNARNQQPGAGDSLILEGQLEWNPTEDLDIWLRYQNFQQHYNGFYGVGAGVSILSPYITGVPTEAGLFLNPFFGLAPNPQQGLPADSNPSLANPFKTNVNTLGHSDIDDDHTFTINATDDLQFATLKYIGGYSQYSESILLDADYNARQYFTSPTGRLVPASYQENSPQSKRWYSNELTLSSEGLDRLRWLVGVYQYGEDYTTGYAINDPLAAYLATPVLNTVTLVPAAPNPQRSIYSQTTSLATNSYASYGQVDYDITPTLRASAAFRYNWDWRDGANDFRYIYDVYGFYGDFPTAPRVGLDVSPALHTGQTTQSYQNQTGKAGLEYHDNSGLLAYGSVARGYLPGGFDLGAFSKIPTVRSETLMDYELGVKRTWGSTLLLDGSAFWYQYNNLQVPVSTAVPGPTIPGMRQAFVYSLNLENAQRARTYGAELEAVWSPLSNLHLTFVYSYLNAAFEEFRNPIPGQFLEDISTGLVYSNLRGNPIPYSPKNKFSFSPQYVAHLPGGDLSLSFTYSYIGSQFDGVFANHNYRAQQYQNLAFTGLYQPTATHWSFLLYARNITNSTQFIYHGPSAFYPQQIAYTVNPPFVLGGEIQYRF